MLPLGLAVTTETPRQRLVRRVRQWMDVNHVNQDVVAERLGMSQAWVSRQLLKTGPEFDRIDAIASMIGCDPGELVSLRESVSFAQSEDRSVPKDATPGPEYGMTSPVSGTPETREAPGEDRPVVPPSLPVSPVHLVLYGLIGALAEEQAKKLWRPLLDMVERVEAGEDPNPKPPKHSR